jgi:hypothetical protein
MDKSVDSASELYGHLDSSAGDFSEIEEQLEISVEQSSSVEKARQKLKQADELQSESFTLLDETVLEAVSYSNGSASYEEDVKSEIREIQNNLDEAANLIMDALNIVESNNIDDESTGFKFGAYSKPSDAIRYILSDARYMAEISDKMKREY